MKTEWMYYFSVLAEHLNYRRAAQALFISQQALSQNIQQLEAELGFPVIVRQQRRVVGLTPAGQAFLERSQQLLQRLQQVEQRLQSASTRQLVLGLSSHCFSLGLEKPLSDLPTAFPEVRVALRPLAANQLEAALLNQEVQLVLNDHALDAEQFAWLPLPTERFTLLVAPSWRQEKLAHLSLIRYQPDLRPQLYTESPRNTRWAQPEADMPVICETNQLSLALKLACGGLGAIYLPESFAAPLLAQGQLQVANAAQELAPQWLERGLGWQRGQKMTEPARWLINQLDRQSLAS
ncbi:MAG: LysR family transcriptional regulator [Candidatus Sericytochromatia bacterium]